MGDDDTHIGRYRVEDRIGAGAHGEIFRARDELLQRWVAIKTLKPSRSGDAHHYDHQKAVAEARALALLRHPNVVTLYELVEHQGGVCLVMEYVDGAPLSARLKDGPLGLDEALRIADQLADALAAAHAYGIVHGDIKPGNILIDQVGAPRVIDFGLARLSGGEDLVATISADAHVASSLAGTLPFMAPEVAMGERPDARADVFSLGAVFYEMLTGRRAFDADSEGGVLQRVLNHAPASMRRANSDIPAALDDIVERMLEKDPARRLSSMTEVRAALARLGGGDAFAAWRLRARQVLRAVTRRRRAWQWARAATVSAAVGVVAWSGVALLHEIAPPVSVRIEQGLDLVQHFENKGAIDKAQDVFERILVDDPQHAAASAGLALALMREYTFLETDPATLRRATSHAEAALGRDPHLALANIAAGWAAEFNSDFDRALRLYDIADVLDTDNPLVFEGRARILKKQGDYDGAIAVLEEAVKAHPHEALFHKGYGEMESRRGNYARAEASYRESIRLAPDKADSYASLSHVLHMQGRTDEAIAVVQDGLKVHQNPELYNNLGAYLFFQGRYAESVQVFKRTLAFEGNSHEYRYWANLADAYRWTPGKDDEARDAYRQAIRLLNLELAKRPDHPALNSRSALYHAKYGDPETAARALERVLSRDRLPPIQLYRATVTLEILGRREEALAMLERALDAGYALNEIANDPELADLRQDRNYQILLARKGTARG